MLRCGVLIEGGRGLLEAIDALAVDLLLEVEFGLR